MQGWIQKKIGEGRCRNFSGGAAFKRFRDDFSRIVLGTAPKKLFDINSSKPEHQKVFTTQKDIVISTLKEAQKKGAYI